MHPVGIFSVVPLCFAFAQCQTISSEFMDPPAKYRPKFRYWLPDASVPSTAVTKDIQAAQAAGIGGLEILPFYFYGFSNGASSVAIGTIQNFTSVPDLPDWSKYGFGNPAFVDVFKDSLSAARDAGITLDYALGANQGQGVPSETGTVGLAVQLLLGNATVEAGEGFAGKIPEPGVVPDVLASGMGFMHPINFWNTPNLTAVIAYEVLKSDFDNTTGSSTVFLEEGSFVDLTAFVQNDSSLQWTPPDSSKAWRIFSIWEAYTNQRSCDGGLNATDILGNGSWIVDHFSKAGASRTTDFWDQYIISDSGIADLLRTVGKYVWEDSMEILSTLYWTPGLLARFNETMGYDLLPYVPTLFSPSNSWNGLLPTYTEVYVLGNDASPANNARQLDYRKVLNDGYQDYVSHFQNWSHSIGMQYSTQPAYNLPLDMLDDIPLIDAPEGESLGFKQIVDAYRQLGGPAHLYNKSVVSTELGAVQVPPYSLRVPDLLRQTKQSFAGGFTMNVLHGYAYSGTYPNTTWPGYSTFWFEFTEMWNQHQPAWQHMKDSLDYVGRNQWVLQQGSPKVDLAFYLYAGPWTPETKYNSTNLLGLGYQYDYLNSENLVSDQAFVQQGKLGIPEYKAVILNNQTVITVDAVDALTKFASNGLPVIIVGPIPNQTYPATSINKGSLNSAIGRLLSESNVYRVDSVDVLPRFLKEANVQPSVSLNCSTESVTSVWRASEGVDYIYIFNDYASGSDCTAEIAASSVTPNVYNAWTGRQSPLVQYSRTNSSLSIPLTFKSNETIILALQHAPPDGCSFTQTTGVHHASGRMTTFNASLPAPDNLNTWDLVIEDWHSAPDRYSVQTEITNHTFINTTLIPWAQLDASLVNVSGVGHYTTTFIVPTLSSPSSPTSDSPSLTGILTLPLIQNTARVYLDGQLLDPIDPVNPVLMLQDLESGKQYDLRIDVTTTLFNRVKSEAHNIWVVGQVASVHQPEYQTLPYEMYGLFGDVSLEWGVIVDVAC
ncbi:hypothetical protein P280DRAFT_394111 [Massarina eburnea CBS 473.64]|uniref:Secreted protein n=1 Tax=Massarina eburnea CBS 473.64 TaxID=1395130 RepID=A0A6A6SB63_9PLEO|nr:hypothetical protein P280DRAFT_394111 [Massarina eburnea CBS 473.64]